MGKLILFNAITLDGYFSGPDNDISWHNADNEEFGRFAVEQTQTADALVFGRVTYDFMASYWTTPEAKEMEGEITGIMNNVPKYVFSHTLTSADWENSTLINEDAAAAMPGVKAKHSGNLFIFGSGNLAASLTRAGLIDEYRLLVHELALGKGTPLFPPGEELRLKLLDVRRFESGNVLLTYARAEAAD